MRAGSQAKADLAEFGAQLARECPRLSAYQIGQLTVALVHMRRKLHRLAEDACNGVDRLTGAETDEGWMRRKLIPAIAHARAMTAELGIEAEYQGDPRGCVLKLKLPSGKTNDFGGEGWCVP